MSPAAYRLRIAMSPSSRRAWIEILLCSSKYFAPMSPSSRRAWIEIALGDDVDDSDYVALLAEGVDRNCNIWQGKSCRSMSPSSRRAWIEMSATMHSMLKLDVALLAEGVDRNDLLCAVCAGGRGRPPRGGRG